MSEQLRIDDLIIQNLQHAQAAVSEALNLSDAQQLSEWPQLIAAMRGLPEKTMQELGIPLIEKVAHSFGIDPKTERGREALKPFQDIIALCLQDCLHLVMQNMDRQRQAAHALRAGQGGLLKS
jgi:hypothetical protein